MRSESRRAGPSSRPWMVLALLTIAFVGSARTATAQEPLVVFLVRHAEKVDDSRDPELSKAGAERASKLERSLRDAGIEHIHSTDFIRTRDTAAPIAKTLGLEIELYDHGNLSGLVEHLRQAGGRHMVVGHSNTTPKVVELLGGKPGSEIDEASEYDRLYVITLGRDGPASTVLMRYGSPYGGS